MNFKKLLISFAIFALPGIVHAQDCGRPYFFTEVSSVKAFMSNEDGTAGILSRLHELAVQSNQFDLTPQTQRAAMDAEYQALLTMLDQLGNGPHRRISRQTSSFLGRVVDSNFLGLAGTTVDGVDVSTARVNAYNAMRAVITATQKMWGCL
jgi:hypothetical protein